MLRGRRRALYFATACLLGVPVLCVGVMAGIFSFRAFFVFLVFGILASISLVAVKTVFPQFFSSHGRLVCHVFAGGVVVTLGLNCPRNQVEIILISVLTIVCFNLILERRGVDTLFDFRRSGSIKSYYESAAAWLLGVFLAIVLFPLRSAVAATLILTVGDPVASLIGRRFQYSHGAVGLAKTWQGSLAFLVSSFLAASLLVPYMQSFVGSLIGMLVEFVSVRIDDNLTIPICSACAMFALSLV